MITSPTIFFCVVSVTVLVLRWLRSNKRNRNPLGLPSPPGPKSIPFFGNALQIRAEEPWLTYFQWSKTYGDIVYSRLFGQGFVIISSEKVARALIDRRSAVYSDRPAMATTKMFGMDFNTGLMAYNDEWKIHRKLFQQALRAEAMPVYHNLHLRKAHELSLNMLNNPLEIKKHLTTYAAAIIMSVTYGYDAKSCDDPFVNRIEELLGVLSKAISPERAALLTALPILGYLPAWFPGAGFKQSALHCRELATHVKDAPFNHVKVNLAAGTARPSIVSYLLSRNVANDGKCDIERSIKDVAATVFLAGADSTVSTLHTFTLAMLLHPEVQFRAQLDIDAVTRGERLPDFDDRPYLPYIEAIFRETLRWHVIVPLGIPHATTADDTYEGYFIPKGSVVVANVWAMSQDEARFKDPTLFKPERHLCPKGRLLDEALTSSPSFGFGRRICPGRFMAEDTIWAAMVSVLATMRIANAKNLKGEEIHVRGDFTTGTSVQPQEFPCSTAIRHMELVKMMELSIKDV